MLQKLEGTFLRWQKSKSGKLKTIQIQTGNIIQSVRIDRDLRALLTDLLTPNISISLQVKVKKQQLIAKFVVLMPRCDLAVDRALIPKPIEVKVCTSRHCCKNGSKDIYQSLEQLQLDGNIGIALNKVGCMGNCKNAPAVKIDGRKYNHLSPVAAVDLVGKIWRKLRPKSPIAKAGITSSGSYSHV